MLMHSFDELVLIFYYAAWSFKGWEDASEDSYRGPLSRIEELSSVVPVKWH